MIIFDFLIRAFICFIFFIYFLGLLVGIYKFLRGLIIGVYEVIQIPFYISAPMLFFLAWGIFVTLYVALPCFLLVVGIWGVLVLLGQILERIYDDFF